MTSARPVHPDLLLAHAGALRSLARSLCGDEHAAEDVLQDTFVRTLVAPPPSQERLGGWLRRVAHGLALRRRRGEAARADRERRYASEGAAIQDSEARGAVLRALVDALLSLEEPYRGTLLLRYFEGLPPRAIAQRQGVPLATVESRLHRGRARLKEKLSRELGADGRGWMPALLILTGGARGAAPAGALGASGAALGAWIVGTKGLVAAAGAAAVVGVAWWALSERGPAAQPPLSDRRAEASEAGAAPPEGLAAVPSAEDPRREVAPAAEAQDAGAPPAAAKGPYEYALVIVPLDAFERPLSAVDCFLAPPGQVLNRAGSTAWDGRLRLAWRGFAPAMELVVHARRDGYGSSDLRRIQLAAGREAVVVLALDERDPAGAQVRLDMSLAVLEDLSLRGFDFSSERFQDPPAFALDGQGNAVFVDPWLLEPPEVASPPAAEGGPGMDLDASMLVSIGGLSQLGYTGLHIGVGSPHVRPSGRIDGELTDQRGEPARGALVTIVCQTDAWRTDLRADEDGRFATNAPSGAFEIRAGGGRHGLARSSGELAEGDAFTWRARLEPGSALPGRLVAGGEALAGWLVEAVDVRGGFTSLGRATTGEDGRFELRNLPPAPLRLLCRPKASGSAPEQVLADGVWPSEAEQELALPERPAPGSARVRLTDPRGEPVVHGEVRLWRVDSGAGRVLADGDEGARTLGGLLPGAYDVEAGAEWLGWHCLGRIQLAPGEALDLGTFAFPERAQADLAFERGGERVEGLRERALCEVELWREGAIVRSTEISAILPGELRLPSGECELLLRRHARASSRASGEESETFEEHGFASRHALRVDPLAGARLALEPLQAGGGSVSARR